jgi:hypothetical protein
MGSTFFFTFPSAWPSNLMMPLKYAEGIICKVIVLETTRVHSFNSFLMATGILICFLLASTSCKRGTTCSMSSSSFLCKIKASIIIVVTINAHYHTYPHKKGGELKIAAEIVDFDVTVS